MTTADFGICPVHGPVAAKHDFSIAVIVIYAVLIFLVIGIFLLPLYIIYVLFIKDRICPYCGSMLYDGPVPVAMPAVYVPVSVYYPYPAQVPYYPPGRR